MRYFSAIQDPKDLENKYVEYTCKVRYQYTCKVRYQYTCKVRYQYTCKVRYTSTLVKYGIPVQQNGGFILLFDRTSLYPIFSI